MDVDSESMNYNDGAGTSVLIDDGVQHCVTIRNEHLLSEHVGRQWSIRLSAQYRKQVLLKWLFA